MFLIPEPFARFMITLHGDAGRAWLERLPAILAAATRRWDLTLAPPFPNLTYHYVAPATRADGTPVVLKACSSTGEFQREAEALRLCDGQGMARLLAAADADEVMLLERLIPGTSLLALTDDDAAMRIAARVMRALWRPVPAEHPFPSVMDWRAGISRYRALYGGTGPIPEALVAEAEDLFAALTATAAPPVVLHGDLHQDNILAAEREPWLAVDPKGLIGEPAYETGPILHNWLPDLLLAPDPRRILARRIDLLSAELGIERARIRGWGLYRAVLVVCEDRVDSGTFNSWGEGVLACAHLLADIKG
jgi:streptomycin 6-kinase